MDEQDTDSKIIDRVREIVRQELHAVMKEREDALLEINPYHKGTGSGGGRFTTKDRGKIYSVPHKHDVKNIPKGRGINKGGKPVAKFGVNTGEPDKQCGKVTIDGNPKRKTRRCSDYPKSYWDQVKTEDLDPETALPISDLQAGKNRTPSERKHRLGYDRELQRLARGVTEGSQTPSEEQDLYSQARTLRRLSGLTEAQSEAGNQELALKCRAAGFRTFDELLKAMDAMKRASDGKLADGKG